MKYNDYELIYMAKEKNEEAIENLYKKYKPLLEKKAREYFAISKNKGVEFNDFLQEAMIGFEEAINVFDQDGEVLFYTFVNICVDRQLKTTFAKLNRDKHKFLNEAVSLDSDDGFCINNYIKETKSNPEDLLIDINDSSILYEKILSVLNDTEKEVFKMKVKGYSLDDISKKLGKDCRSITNFLYRIRIKVKEMLNKEK